MYNYDPKQEIIEIEDFFPKYTQKEIAGIFCNSSLNWKYVPTISYSEKNNFNSSWIKDKIQETDGFLAPIDQQSMFYKTIINAMKTSLKKFLDIDGTEFYRIMFVITPPNPLYNLECHLTPHVDVRNSLPYKNFLYYVYDNDAETIFFNQKYDKNTPTDFGNQEIIHRIKPKQGKAVIWDGSILHAGNVSRTDKRCTLNILFK